MIIDELITLLGFKVDKSSADEAKNAVNGIQAGLNRLGAVVGFGAAIAAFEKFTELGHDAAETLERVDHLFGSSSAANDWADGLVGALGRSRQELLKSSVGFGVMVQGFGIVGAESTAMAQKLTELAVKIAEVSGAEDAAASGALEAALMGRTRALSRLGVTVSDVDMKEAAARLGLHGKIEALTEAQRAQVTYNAILLKSAGLPAAQADATEVFEARLKNLRDTIAGRVFGAAERLAGVGEKVLALFDDLAANTHVFESALVVLAPAAITAGAALVAPFLPAIAMFAAMVLIVDDLWTLFSGGDSIIGRALDSFGGAGTAKAIVEQLKEAGAGLFYLFEQSWPTIKHGFQETIEWCKAFFKLLNEVGEWVGSSAFWTGEVLTNFGVAIGNAMADAAQSVERLWDKFTALGDNPVFKAIGAMGSKALKLVTGGGAQQAVGAATAPIEATAPSRAGNTTNNTSAATGNVTVNVTATGTAAQAEGAIKTAAQAAGQGIDRQMRDANAALRRRK